MENNFVYSRRAIRCSFSGGEEGKPSPGFRLPKVNFDRLADDLRSWYPPAMRFDAERASTSSGSMIVVRFTMEEYRSRALPD